MDELEALLRGARAGERQANDGLGRWLDQALRGFFGSMFDEELSRELAQRTVVALLEKLATTPTSAPELVDALPRFGYIEMRRWRSERKRELQRAVWRSEHAEVQETPRGIEELFAGRESWALVSTLLDELPAGQREVLVARLAGYSYATIAATFGIKIENARARAYLAKQYIVGRLGIARVTRSVFRTDKKAS